MNGMRLDEGPPTTNPYPKGTFAHDVWTVRESLLALVVLVLRKLRLVSR
jgi:hypothetical protein